jgi:hypothetical protein
MSRFSIALKGPYTGRFSAVNAADSASGYWGVGIWGTFIWGQSVQSTDKDQRYLNCFTQTVSGPNGASRVYLVKRPGFGTLNTPATGKYGYAITVWAGNANKVITAFDTPNSTIYDGTTSLGAITGVAASITETVVGTSMPTLAVTSTDSTAWYYDTGVGVMTKITDGDFPGNAGYTLAGAFAHIDGFGCIMTTDGKLWATDLNSLTAWTANSYDTVGAYPDRGVGCVRHKNYVMAFSRQHVEFWYNAGLSPFPLARANAMTVKVGAVSSDAIAEIADTKFWCGAPPEGGLSIFQYDGSLSRISTPEIDAILTLAGSTNITLSTIRNIAGRSFVLVKAGATTKAYCVEEKFWHEWNTTTPLWYKTAAASISGTMVNYAISNVSTAGKVFLMNPASLVFTDNGDTYTARFQTSPEDQGSRNKKFYSWMDIDADTEASTSTLTVAKTDDDYATIDTIGTVDLSSAGSLRLTRLGSAYSRAWIFSHSANTPMRLRSIGGEYQKGQA